MYKYTYDEANQLIREDSSVNSKSYTYTYDKGGNIALKSEYAYTTGTLGTATDTINYSYNNSSWKDELTSYDGKAITYDEIGNPLVYDDVTYSWRNRQLIQYENYDNDILTIYKYNAEGLMTRKGVLELNSNNSYATSRVYDYYWSDNTLIGYKLVTYNIDNGSILSTSYIQCLYSQNDEAIGFIVNSTSLTAPEVYYYVKNLQGDITEIVDETGAKVVSYTYDAWGNMASYAPGTSDAEVTRAASVTFYNPFFYRGYLLDKDTGYYYLQSRFYNPEWGRFLNADTTDVLQDAQGDAIRANLFAYCGNDPVNYTDPTGEWYTSYKITIFYGDKDKTHSFWEGAKYLRDDFYDIYGDYATVDLKYFYKITFKQLWDKLPEQEVVVLLGHGDPVSLNNWFSTHGQSIESIYDLKPKKIKYLILLSCNCGHFSYLWRNMAFAFSQRIKGGVVAASDGRVEYSKDYHYFYSTSRGGWRDWKGRAGDRTLRSNYGWVFYRTKDGIASCWYKNYLYKVTMSSLINYMEQREFLYLKY